jgi:hypothetical protein
MRFVIPKSAWFALPARLSVAGRETAPIPLVRLQMEQEGDEVKATSKAS